MAQQKKTVQPTKTPRKSSRKEKLEKAKEDNVAKKYRDWETDRKSTRLNSSHSGESRMPSSA